MTWTAESDVIVWAASIDNAASILDVDREFIKERRRHLGVGDRVLKERRLAHSYDCSVLWVMGLGLTVEAIERLIPGVDIVVAASACLVAGTHIHLATSSDPQPHPDEWILENMAAGGRELETRLHLKPGAVLRLGHVKVGYDFHTAAMIEAQSDLGKVSDMTIAKRLGCAGTQVQAARVRLGIPAAMTKEYWGRRRAEMVAHIRAGKSDKEVSELTGISRTTVRRFRSWDKNGLDTSGPLVRNRKRPTIERKVRGAF